MKYLSKYGTYLCYVIVSFLFLFVIASGNERKTVNINNVNYIKSIPVNNLSMVYKSITEEKKEEVKVYSTFNEAISNAPNEKVSFYGKLTGYGPDCKGCGGKTACRPSQNVKNGNIYYNDSDYGKIRILAADKNIPCGSIIKLSNINIYSEPIIAVVLDRGGAIKGNHLDLLFETEKDMGGFSTQSNIKFDIIRWGF